MDVEEIVRLFREAAIGLEAVHRAGLVHRDFKPANVLVGRDGRVRIADFGLVHLVAGPPPSRPSGNEPATSSVTASGAVIGTPAYLAPEQLHGKADARSDQFSFCVALFEACFGHRPFEAATLEELDAAVGAGTLRLPKVLPRGTRRLVPILRRGLARAPADRFPDLRPIIAALSPSPIRRRSGALLGMGVLVAGAALIGFRAARGPAPSCAAVDRALAGIWDAPRRQTLQTIFLSRRSSGNAPAWEKISTALDAYAAEWLGRRRDACMHPGTDDASRGLVAARVACLDRRLGELRLLSELLASSDLEAAENAPQALLELRSPASCEQEAAGLSDLSAEEQAVLKRLTELRLMWVGGRHNQAALDLARSVLPASERARPAIHAMALLRSGQLELRHSLDVGVAQLRQAALLAETARDDEVRAEALTYLALAMSDLTAPSDLALGEQYAEQAMAVLARLGGDRHLSPLVLSARGLLLRARERYDESVEQFQRALDLLDRDPAPDPRQRGQVLAALGFTYYQMGRAEDAVPYLERALAVTEESAGPRNPMVCAALINLGEALFRAGRARDAIPHLERAVALAEVGWGADSRNSAEAALFLGLCRADQGDPKAARPLLERALAISSGLASGDHLRFEIRLALGQHLVKSGEPSRGRALLEEALRDGAPPGEFAAEARFALAQALPLTERLRARELADQARATYVGAGARRKKEVAAIDAWLARIR